METPEQGIDLEYLNILVSIGNLAYTYLNKGRLRN